MRWRPGVASSRMQSGRIAAPLSPAALSAGWSASRRSLRNQTMIGAVKSFARAKGCGKRRIVVNERVLAEAAEHEALQRWRVADAVENGDDGDVRRARRREAVGAGRDGGKGDRAQAVL